jgi:dUTP pyrophosphatase
MKIARFEKVSLEQFENDAATLFPDQKADLYSIPLPVRATSGSAGYDFYTPFEIVLRPGEFKRVPSGIRCRIDEGYVLEIYPRSSLGFKYQMALANTTGIIDSDYYNADNEGHIIIGIVNRGDHDLYIKKGDRFVQGIFKRYYLAEEEDIFTFRHGGFGSTD